ncbi:hypothetical protein Vretimale_16197 [Volvox reticuliferus]|uniref:Uncharacterized protein n=1 Tax=Volvox reticuliferus TaxID=1737510 RepID=A0A8J4LWI7_9CHLO|nr:hypothetical protein Vretimale_16197 [Volvox reticuliferus]
MFANNSVLCATMAYNINNSAFIDTSVEEVERVGKLNRSTKYNIYQMCQMTLQAAYGEKYYRFLINIAACFSCSEPLTLCFLRMRTPYDRKTMQHYWSWLMRTSLLHAWWLLRST